MPCPPGQHQFKEEGVGLTYISEHSSIKWKTTSKTTTLVISTSSSTDEGSVEITNFLKVKSSITVCQKCRAATGPAVAIVSIAVLRQIAEKFPQLQVVLERALALPAVPALH